MEKLPPALLPALRLAAALGLCQPYYLQPYYLQPDYRQPHYLQPHYLQPHYLQPHYLWRGTGDGQRQLAKAATG